MAGKLRVEDKIFPNGTAYKQITYDREVLGSYTVEVDGYLPWGKRKPRKSEFEAILDVVGDRQREAQKWMLMLDRARDEVFERQHEFGV